MLYGIAYLTAMAMVSADYMPLPDLFEKVTGDFIGMRHLIWFMAFMVSFYYIVCGAADVKQFLWASIFERIMFAGFTGIVEVLDLFEPATITPLGGFAALSALVTYLALRNPGSQI